MHAFEKFGVSPALSIPVKTGKTDEKPWYRTVKVAELKMLVPLVGAPKPRGILKTSIEGRAFLHFQKWFDLAETYPWPMGFEPNEMLTIRFPDQLVGDWREMGKRVTTFRGYIVDEMRRRFLRSRFLSVVI